MVYHDVMGGTGEAVTSCIYTDSVTVSHGIFTITGFGHDSGNATPSANVVRTEHHQDPGRNLRQPPRLGCGVFGNPCGDSYKYLTGNYECSTTGKKPGGDGQLIKGV